MGRLIRVGAAALLLAGTVAGLAPARAMGFSGFGPMSADATYGVSMTFDVQLSGGAPDALDLLLRFADDDGSFVAPVQPQGSRAEYVWDAADQYVTPNTTVTYQWRATVGDQVTLSPERALLYDDDRPGLDWQSARLGEATVHWYGDAEAQARHFGELSADGAARAEQLLGHDMTAPVDIFVYDSQEDFFGALGPGAREWTGAATYPHIRTIFMWRQASSDASYFDATLVHEVTHVVFSDATDNPFHEPAKWLNEGLATWAETQSAGPARSTVEFEASGGGLFAFAAIAEQFPIGDRGARLSYAQGATMVDMIVSDYGRGALAQIAAAYRDGASDDEALQAGTGVQAEDLYAAYYEQYGVEPPQPIEPDPIAPSNVRKPGGGSGTAASGAPGPTPDATPGSPSGGGDIGPWVVGGVLVVVAVVAIVAVAAQRRVRRAGLS